MVSPELRLRIFSFGRSVVIKTLTLPVCLEVLGRFLPGIVKLKLSFAFSTTVVA